MDGTLLATLFIASGSIGFMIYKIVLGNMKYNKAKKLEEETKNNI